MVSNKEQEFKEALNSGNLAEAFLLAMNSAVELKITTWVESSQSELKEDSKDTKPHQEKETPGHSLKSRINLIQGEIENKIGDQFLTNSELSQILPFHFHQVSLSSHNFRNNLQSLQKLFGLLAALNQQDNSQQLLELLNLENQFISETPSEIPLPPLELGIKTKTPPVDVIPVPVIPKSPVETKVTQVPLEIEPKEERLEEFKSEIKAEIKEQIKAEIKEQIKAEIKEEPELELVTPAPEMPVSDLDEEDWEESNFVPSAISFEEETVKISSEIEEKNDYSLDILSLDDLEESPEEDWGDVALSHDNLDLDLEIEETGLNEEDIPALKLEASAEELADFDIPVIELEEVPEEEDWGDVERPHDILELDLEGEETNVEIGLRKAELPPLKLESETEIEQLDLGEISEEEDWGDLDIPLETPLDNLELEEGAEITFDHDLSSTFDLEKEEETPFIALEETPTFEAENWDETDQVLGLESEDLELEETPQLEEENWDETDQVLGLESENNFDLDDLDNLPSLDLELEETPQLEEENWEETDHNLGLESEHNFDLGDLDNLPSLDFESEETPQLEEENWEETDHNLGLESENDFDLGLESEDLDNLPSLDLELEETPQLEEENWEETDNVLGLESENNFDLDDLDNLPSLDLELEETPQLEEENWEETDHNLGLESENNFDLGDLDNLPSLDFESEETPQLEEENWEETDHNLGLESENNFDLDDLDNLPSLDLELEETPQLEEENWEETDNVLGLESENNFDLDDLDNLPSLDLELEETPQLEEENWEETDNVLGLESENNFDLGLDDLDNLPNLDLESEHNLEDFTGWTEEEESTSIPNFDSLNLDDNEDWIEEGDENPFAEISSEGDLTDLNLNENDSLQSNPFEETSLDENDINSLDDLGNFEHFDLGENEEESLFDDIISETEDKNISTLSSDDLSLLDDDLFNSLTTVKPRPSNPKKSN